jgi:PilZ domain
MKPVDQFLKSVREVFAQNRDADWTQIGLFLLAAIALSIALSVSIGRRRLRLAVARRIANVATGAGLKSPDLDYLTRISHAAGLPLLGVMTHLESFEKATARALEAEVPTQRPVEGSVFESIRRLRKSLNFSPLPAHHWLLSTRELVVGEPIVVAGVTRHVVDVNEATFAVDLPATTALALGPFATIAIVRTDDSRYLSRVRHLATEALAGTGAGLAGGEIVRRTFFGHDERPQREQHRQHVRMRPRIPVTVTVGIADPPTLHDPSEAAAAGAETITGTLLDVSAGGLSLELPMSSDSRIRNGTHLRCSFALDEAAVFEALGAVVVTAEAATRPNVQRLRLTFTALAEDERDRIASAVARHQRTPSIALGS